MIDYKQQKPITIRFYNDVINGIKTLQKKSDIKMSLNEIVNIALRSYIVKKTVDNKIVSDAINHAIMQYKEGAK